MKNITGLFRSQRNLKGNIAFINIKTPVSQEVSRIYRETTKRRLHKTHHNSPMRFKTRSQVKGMFLLKEEPE